MLSLNKILLNLTLSPLIPEKIKSYLSLAMLKHFKIKSSLKIYEIFFTDNFKIIAKKNNYIIICDSFSNLFLTCSPIVTGVRLVKMIDSFKILCGI